LINLFQTPKQIYFDKQRNHCFFSVSVKMSFQQYYKGFLSTSTGNPRPILWVKMRPVKHKLGGRPPQYGPAPSSWPLTLKVVSESRVMWATSVPILVFLGLSLLDLARCTRQTDVRHASSF